MTDDRFHTRTKDCSIGGHIINILLLTLNNFLNHAQVVFSNKTPVNSSDWIPTHLANFHLIFRNNILAVISVTLMKTNTACFEMKAEVGERLCMKQFKHVFSLLVFCHKTAATSASWSIEATRWDSGDRGFDKPGPVHIILVSSTEWTAQSRSESWNTELQINKPALPQVWCIHVDTTQQHQPWYEATDTIFVSFMSLECKRGEQKVTKISAVIWLDWAGVCGGW